jgi:HK97 family phage portal protein
MNILGLSITRAKSAPVGLQSVDNRSAWWPIIRESFAGAWQTNTEITVSNVTTNPTVFACTTLIASDIAKMRIRLVQQDANGIWTEKNVPAFSPVLRKPNHFQNRIQFYENWVTAKLLNGNTYALKQRDKRGAVVKLYILDSNRVTPLVAPNGDVYYELKEDHLSQLRDGSVTAPASEIIHDRQNCFFHPLVGLSSIYACGLAAVQGLNIQENSTRFFASGSNPGGVLTAPLSISQETADRIKAYWDENFTGDNVGKVAVLGDGLKYEAMSVKAVDAQLIEQLKWTSDTICSAFKVPPYMVGVGTAPAYNNIEALNQQYYSQCLQVLIESIELCLDEGLGLTTGDIASEGYGTEFDIDDLLRMDSATMMTYLEAGKNYLKPNEGRRKLNLPPVAGGDTVLRQQQDFSLSALAKRDALADPFATAKPAAPTPPPEPSPANPDGKASVDLITKGFREKLAA